jgi:DNA-binding transcriptional MerR regulator
MVEQDKVVKSGPPPQTFKVGDLMRITGLSRQTIHNYTMLGLIHPMERTESGHRLYGEDAYRRLQKVIMLRIHRTMEEVKQEIDKEFGPGPSANRT